MTIRDKLEAMKQTDERNRQHEQEWRERQNMKTVIQWTEGEKATVETNVPERIRQLKYMCEHYPEHYQIIEENPNDLYIKIISPVAAVWNTFPLIRRRPAELTVSAFLL